MRKLCIIKAGSTFPSTALKYGDFDAWVCKGIHHDPGAVRVVDAENGEALPEADTCSGVVVTGSHDMVTDNLPWSESIAAWIPSLVNAAVPFLGICFGHQLLAYAMGGQVGFHPGGREIGTVEVTIQPESHGDVLFRSLPSPFKAHASHAQTVLSLPPGAVRLASNSFEANHTFRLGPCAWGVQFHPEYDTNIMQSYIRIRARELAAAGMDVVALLRAIEDTPVAETILRRFSGLVGSGGRELPAS